MYLVKFWGITGPQVPSPNDYDGRYEKKEAGQELQRNAALGTGLDTDALIEMGSSSHRKAYKRR